MDGTAVQLAYPLDDLRLRFLERCATLLREHLNSHNFMSILRYLILSEQEDAIADLHRVLQLSPGPASHIIDNLLRRSRHVQSVIGMITDDSFLHQQHKGDNIKEIIQEFDRMSIELATSMIDKSLLERQSRVLERIILSYEKVTQWRNFIQQVLIDIHSIFPFHFFTIIFSGKQALNFHIYSMGLYTDGVRAALRERLVPDILGYLKLPISTTVDTEEFLVLKEASTANIGNSNFLTVYVPEYLERQSGILGISFVPKSVLNVHEENIIRSILSIMIMVIDSSKVLNRTLSELEYYSSHDTLTGLYNRRHFNEMGEYEIGRSERHHRKFSLLLIDLDDFKEINDSYGHPTGDNVLRVIGDILKRKMRKGDLACRMGGDEFGVLLPETSLDGGIRAGNGLRELISSYNFLDPSGLVFHVRGSVGVVSYPEDATTFAELMLAADISLYHGKSLGKNVTAHINSTDALKEIRSKRTDVEMLRQAIAEDRLVPYFQPIVHCHSGEPFAYESLARLTTENGEVTSAATFIETAEQYGLSNDLDRIIIEKALREQGKLKKKAEIHSRLFINLSAQEIQGRGIIDYAEKLCKQLGIAPDDLVFEILERDTIIDMAHMGTFLSDLRKKGFAFALDDFGSGYNSFYYLRELHFDFVKLDGAYVRNILNSSTDLALVRNLVNLCRDLGIKTIAEHVETAEILNALKEIGADYVQGYHIGKPRQQMIE